MVLKCVKVIIKIENTKPWGVRKISTSNNFILIKSRIHQSLTEHYSSTTKETRSLKTGQKLISLDKQMCINNCLKLNKVEK